MLCGTKNMSHKWTRNKNGLHCDIHGGRGNFKKVKVNKWWRWKCDANLTFLVHVWHQLMYINVCFKTPNLLHYYFYSPPSTMNITVWISKMMACLITWLLLAVPHHLSNDRSGPTDMTKMFQQKNCIHICLLNIYPLS